MVEIKTRKIEDVPGDVWRVHLLVKDFPLKNGPGGGLYLVGIEAEKPVTKDAVLLVLRLAEKMLDETEWKTIPDSSGPTKSS